MFETSHVLEKYKKKKQTKYNKDYETSHVKNMPPVSDYV